MHNEIVFVAGALRSGTTMLRLMLDSHPQLTNPGEVDFLFDKISNDGLYPPVRDYLDWLSTNRIFLAKQLKTDPSFSYPELIVSFVEQFQRKNFTLTMNIHRGFSKAPKIFPNALYIHLLRDPRDVARSSVGMGWAGHPFFGVNHWINSEKSWDSLKMGLREDQYIDVRYEHLVADPEVVLTRICEFLRIPYSNAMLCYPQHSNYQPPDPQLAYQWKSKLSKPQVQLVESKAADMIEERGYKLSGYQPCVPGPIERRFLKTLNISRISAFEIARYGPVTFLLDKISKLFGLKKLAKSVILEKNYIDMRHLK